MAAAATKSKNIIRLLYKWGGWPWLLRYVK
jgi:hypothetical protein